MSGVKISIIVPTYNQELYLARCIRSLLNQSMNKDEYEIIVINDGSTDNTKNILEPFLNNIKYLVNKKNMGLAKSLNVGIKNSTAQFIVRVDSDDWVHREYLMILSLHLSMNLDIDAVACDYQMHDNKQKVVEYCNCEEKPIGCGIMFRYKDLVEIGLYDTSFKLREEEDLRIRFLEKYSIDRVKIPLYYYRQHETNITKNKHGMEFYQSKLKKKHS